MNEIIAFEEGKLKTKEVIHACFPKDGVLHINLIEMIRVLKSISTKTHIWVYEEGEEDLFPDVSQEANNSVQFSY